MKALVIVLVLPIFGFCQKDSIIGKIKSIKEVVVYLDSTKQQPRLFETDGDYGHSGFMNPKAALSNMTSSWYDWYFTRFGSYHKLYDISGKIESETWYYKNGEELTRYEYKYDGAGNLIEEKQILPYDQSYYMDRHFFDEYKNLKRSTIHFRSDNPSSYGYRNYSYDDTGNLIKYRQFDEFGFTNGRSYSYNSNGKMSAQYEFSEYKRVTLEDGSTTHVHDSIGENILQAKFLYDANNNLIEKRYFNEGKESGIELYKYDEAGRLIETRLPIGAIHSIEYQKDGKIARMINSFKSLQDSTVRIINTYFYDKMKNVKRVELFHEGENYVLEFSYIFDSQKNWIQQTKTVNGKKLYLRRREIEYY